MIGVDLAKRVFQLHGTSMTGHVTFRKKLMREQFQRLVAKQPACVIVFEARDGGRDILERDRDLDESHVHAPLSPILDTPGGRVTSISDCLGALSPSPRVAAGHGACHTACPSAAFDRRSRPGIKDADDDDPLEPEARDALSPSRCRSDWRSRVLTTLPSALALADSHSGCMTLSGLG
jgi:hypothetical protein